MAYAFDFAISFSRECRDRARILAELLEEQGAIVFYDHSFLEHLLGKRLDDELAWVFGGATRYFVPFVSTGYRGRPWPQYEWSIAKLEAERRQEEFILPLRVDDSLLFGLPDTVGYLDLREIGLDRVADVLIRKLKVSKTKIDTGPNEGEWVVTFGVKTEDLHRQKLPADAPSDTPWLYDWLTEDLMKRLTQGALPTARVIEDLRTGETLSVRLQFMWDPSEGALDFGELAWWELLELSPYDAIFGDGDGDGAKAIDETKHVEPKTEC